MLDRFELKFLANEAQRSALLEACRGRLEPDPHGAGSAYRVTSQYFDAPDLRCYREKLDGVSSRTKYRLRTYGDPGEEPYFLEIKRRRARRIHKERARLRPDGAREILEAAGLLRDLAPRVDPDVRDRSRALLNRVQRVARQWPLRASNVVAYRREAYLGRLEERLRVTFDHEVAVRAPGDWRGGPARPLVGAGSCVLEVKFDLRLPGWLREALVALRLQARPFSKYGEGMAALGAAAVE